MSSKDNNSEKRKKHLSAADKSLLAGKTSRAAADDITVTGHPPPSPPPLPPAPPPPPQGGSSPPPPPPGCPPPQPSPDWAKDMKSALDAGNADANGVQRAIENWDAIAKAANAHGIDPAMLAGIALRETNFRTINQIGGGNGRGVFQIDIGIHPDISEAQANDLNFAADWAANYLAQNKATIQQRNPNFTGQDLDHAVAASYNLGPNDFSGDPSKIDVGSKNNNYGQSVLGMMPAFKDPVTGLTPKAGSANGGKDGC